MKSLIVQTSTLVLTERFHVVKHTQSWISISVKKGFRIRKSSKDWR